VTGTEIEVLPPSRSVQRAVAWWRPSKMLPASYVTNGVVDLESLQRAAERLEALNLDPYDNLGDTFVIKGQVGLSAALQRALLERVGYRVLFDYADDKEASGRVMFPDGQTTPPLTIHITDTDIANYAKQNKRNYDEKPRRMLEARLSTELISLYAAGVIRGIITAAGLVDVTVDASDTIAAAPPAPQLPPRSVAPSGATIAEPDREPAIDDTVRDQLTQRIAELDQSHQADLLVIWRALAIPPLKSLRLTRAHGALIDRLVTEAADYSTPATPPAVIDDTPEAAGFEAVDPETGEIDYGEPF
jgi:hypothetical protein